MDAVILKTSATTCILKECLEDHNLFIHPEQIYSMDEKGMPLDPKPPKMVTQNGQTKMQYRPSGKKIQITGLGCANAVGQPQPPVVRYQVHAIV